MGKKQYMLHKKNRNTKFVDVATEVTTLIYFSK